MVYLMQKFAEDNTHSIIKLYVFQSKNNILLGVAFQKTVAEQPLTTHLTNHTCKKNKTHWSLQVE